MDKNDLVDAKKRHHDLMVHKLPDRMRQVHEDYGLWILSYGDNKTPVDGFYRTRKRYFEFYSISHLYSGKGKLWLPPDNLSDIVPGQCVIISPDTINRYGGVDGKYYHEDSICFYGPVADMLFRAGIIKNGVFELGKARLILSIKQLAGDPARDSQINANIALQNLLIEIYNKNKRIETSDKNQSSVIESLLKNVRNQIERWWTVEEMSEFCSLSKDHFRRVFKKHTGMLPKSYIDRLKMQKAAELLISSDRRITEIAEELEYHDCYHFSRRFKQVMGLPPRQYRQQFGAK